MKVKIRFSDSFSLARLIAAGYFLFPFFAALGAFLLMTACGGKQSASAPSSSAASSGTGSISFAVEWEPPPASAVSPKAGMGSTRPLVSNIDVCEDYGVDTITMQVYRLGTMLTQGVFSCDLHTGTLTVEAKDNLSLLLLASVQGVANAWTGQYENLFSVSPGQETNLGKITMKNYNGSDNVRPWVTSFFPADNDADFPDNVSLRVRFSETMAIHTVTDNDAVRLIDNVTGLAVPVTYSYDNTSFAISLLPHTPLTGARYYRLVLDNTSVTDMAGNRLDDYYDISFKVHLRGTWERPYKIDLNNTVSTISIPRIAMDNAGNAVVVWSKKEGINNKVYAARYKAAEGLWDNGFVFDSMQGNATDPDVSLGANGNAFVAWIHKDSSGASYVLYKQYSRDGVLGPTHQLDTLSGASGGSLGGVKIAMNEVGKGYAVWTEYLNGTTSSVYTDDIMSPNGYYYHYQLTYDDFYPATNPAVSSSKTSDNVIYVWRQYDNVVNRYRIHSKITNKYPADDVIDNNATGNAYELLVAMDEAGNAHVLWQGDTGIWASRYLATTKTWNATLLSGGQTNARFLSMAADKNGNAIAAWVSNGPNNLRQVVSRRFLASSGLWEAAISHDSTTSPDPLGYNATAVGINENGTAFLVYQYYDRMDYTHYWSRRYVNGQGWGSLMVIDGENTDRFAGNGQGVAVDADGNAIAAWIKISDANGGQGEGYVWASRFW